MDALNKPSTPTIHSETSKKLANMAGASSAPFLFRLRNSLPSHQFTCLWLKTKELGLRRFWFSALFPKGAILVYLFEPHPHKTPFFQGGQLGRPSRGGRAAAGAELAVRALGVEMRVPFLTTKGQVSTEAFGPRSVGFGVHAMVPL